MMLTIVKVKIEVMSDRKLTIADFCIAYNIDAMVLRMNCTITPQNVMAMLVLNA